MRTRTTTLLLLSACSAPLSWAPGEVGQDPEEPPPLEDPLPFPTTEHPPTGQDSDDDGVVDGLDCAPTDPLVYPGSPELCDGIDNNCDALLEPDGTLTYHPFAGPPEDLTHSMGPGEPIALTGYGELVVCPGTYPGLDLTGTIDVRSRDGLPSVVIAAGPALRTATGAEVSVQGVVLRAAGSRPECFDLGSASALTLDNVTFEGCETLRTDGDTPLVLKNTTIAGGALPAIEARHSAVLEDVLWRDGAPGATALIDARLAESLRLTRVTVEGTTDARAVVRTSGAMTIETSAFLANTLGTSAVVEAGPGSLDVVDTVFDDNDAGSLLTAQGTGAALTRVVARDNTTSSHAFALHDVTGSIDSLQVERHTGGRVLSLRTLAPVTGQDWAFHDNAGGAVLVSDESQLTLVRGTFTGNQANEGAAILARAAVLGDPLVLGLTDVVATDNTALLRGGALHLVGAVQVQMTGGALTANTAPAGGAIYLAQGLSSAEPQISLDAVDLAAAPTDNTPDDLASDRGGSVSVDGSATATCDTTGCQ